MTVSDKQMTARLYNDADTDPIDPFELFEVWLAAAGEVEVNDANAMALATVDADGMPNVRMMLLNGFDKRGFVFFTNLNSAKGGELTGHAKAALNFHWKSLRRQVRVRGNAELLAPHEADTYFATRPRGSQVGAHASRQSSPLASWEELITRVEDLTMRFGDKLPIPRPSHWSGYRIVPGQIEFWKNGAFRLHKRMLFSRGTNGEWRRQRLSP